MIKIWLKHKIFDYAISRFFDSVIVSFSPEGKIVLTADQLNDSLIGTKLYWLKTGYGGDYPMMLQNLSHAEFILKKDPNNAHMKKLYNVNYVVWSVNANCKFMDIFPTDKVLIEN